MTRLTLPVYSSTNLDPWAISLRHAVQALMVLNAFSHSRQVIKEYIDLENYKVKRFISFKALLDQLLIRTVFAYFA